MPKITFFPLGNADTCLINLDNDRRALFDFADMSNPDDEEDKRCNLEQELRDRLDGDKEIDVVAFTHLDTDHCKRASEVFWLEHASKYQNDMRIKIKTMWVPATAILEEGVEGQARTLRSEARHRFIEGEGIRVFGRPDALDDFLRKRGIDPTKRRNLISDAGTLTPEFSLAADGVEFFVLSPFAEHCEDDTYKRNDTAIFVQVTFQDGERLTRLLLSADVGHEVIDDIIRVTRNKNNGDRLIWDINNVPHHTSYLSLATEKGEDVTEPEERIKWLYEEQSQPSALLVSTSCPIPGNDDSDQPPHRQAANYYRRVARDCSGQFLVTMEHPSRSKPKPLEIDIGSKGYSVIKSVGGSAALLTSAAPRAGRDKH